MIEGVGEAVPDLRKRASSPVEHRQAVMCSGEALAQKDGRCWGHRLRGDAWRLDARGSEDVEGEDMFILLCAAGGLNDPLLAAEWQIMALSRKLNQKPTLPLQYQNLCSAQEAYDPPSWHCSFRRCSFASESEKELTDHIPRPGATWTYLRKSAVKP